MAAIGCAMYRYYRTYCSLTFNRTRLYLVVHLAYKLQQMVRQDEKQKLNGTFQSSTNRCPCRIYKQWTADLAKRGVLGCDKLPKCAPVFATLVGALSPQPTFMNQLTHHDSDIPGWAVCTVFVFICFLIILLRPTRLGPSLAPPPVTLGLRPPPLPCVCHPPAAASAHFRPAHSGPTPVTGGLIRSLELWSTGPVGTPLHPLLGAQRDGPRSLAQF